MTDLRRRSARSPSARSPDGVLRGYAVRYRSAEAPSANLFPAGRPHGRLRAPPRRQLSNGLVAAVFSGRDAGCRSLIVGQLRVRGSSARPAAPAAAAVTPSAVVPRARCRFPCCRSATARRSASATPPRPSRPASAARPRAAARKSIAARLGERLTRFYEYAGFRFILVYEPFERNGEPRVAAIYLP